MQSRVRASDAAESPSADALGMDLLAAPDAPQFEATLRVLNAEASSGRVVLYSGSRAALRCNGEDFGEVVVTLVGCSQLASGDVGRARISVVAPPPADHPLRAGSEIEVHHLNHVICRGRISSVCAATPDRPNRLADQDRRTRITVAYLLLGSVAFFALVDSLIVSLTDWIGPNDPAALLVLASFGAIGAQAGLHSIWCVLAPVACRRRVALGVLVALAWFAAWALGYFVQAHRHTYLSSRSGEVVFSMFLCLPLFAIAIQAPLWTARIWFGWRIASPNGDGHRADNEAFRIRHLLIAIGVVAICLALARWARPTEPPSKFVVPVVIGALSAAAVSLCTTLPTAAAALRARRFWIAVPAVVPLHFIVFVAFVATIEMFGNRVSGREQFHMIAVILSCDLCLVAVLLGARGLGYRLHWGRRDEG